MRNFLLISWIFLAMSGSAGAAPLERKDVPKPLQPWVDWALRGREDQLCPFLHERAGEKPCAWPAELSLSLDDRAGRFSQKWRVFGAAQWAPLPGDSKTWPQAATVDGRPAAVVLRGGGPAVRLEPGAHSVSGSLGWESLPQILQVPVESGLVSLSVSGSLVPIPVRDASGRLWLRKRQVSQEGPSAVAVTVHRKIVDEVPLELHTQVQLRVSGKSREVLLGRALPKGFQPLSLSGALPARLDPDGRLRVQVRPGSWTILLVARREGPAAKIVLEESGGDWDDEEAWVFEARRELRLTEVKGPPAIDPQQTELPGGWRELPAYLMRPGDEMVLEERRRGDSDPQPDRLSLAREFLLDFDGGGFTVHDRLRGSLSRSWRLAAGPRMVLGRAAADGADQFITALEDGGPAGVELRQGSVDLAADSRIEGRGRFPAVGWAADFESVSASLHLPAGWTLVHAFGADEAAPSWIGLWSLLDFFLVLVISIAAGRLWGRRWGAAALAATTLCWHEPKALHWIWLVVVAVEAVHRALPDGRIRAAARIGRGVSWGFLGLFALSFAATELRGGLYPQLDRRAGRGGFALRALTRNVGVVSGAAQDVGEGSEDKKEIAEFENVPMRQADQYLLPGVANGPGRRKSGKVLARPAPEAPAPKQMIYYDPSSKVNTGPGLPNWRWNTARLSWRGPVKAEQGLRLVLISPGANLLLAFARVGLVAALALLMFGLPVADWLVRLRAGGGAAELLRRLFPALLILLAPPLRAGEAGFEPSERILNELRGRMLEAPDCAPRCAEIPRLRLSASPGALTMRLEIHAQAESGVPLPGGLGQWEPKSVSLDGTPAAALRRSPDGLLWLRVGPGAHQVLIEGPLPERDSVSVPLPLKPRRVEVSASGWSVAGVAADGAPDDNLQLSRERRAGDDRGDALEPGKMPPFVRVERTLDLGLTWTARTRVVRLSPADSAIVLSVPLLPGESVNSEAVRVKDGKALVSMGPQASEASWYSTIKEAPSLELKAPEGVSWVEDWTLDASPIWHITASGIPTVHPGNSPAHRTRRWRPWPGESVTIGVSRPAGVPGRTLTIDASRLAWSPGLRASDATLTLTLRASRGGRHAISLPEGAELRSVKIDGALQPVRQEKGRVDLPVRPGTQTVELVWRRDGGLGPLARTPAADLGAPSVNALLSVSMPRDRWTLAVFGPRVGPAVLFWPLLLVFLLVAAGLGKIPLTPLGWKQWFLLSLGLTQMPLVPSAIIALWLIALGWRGENPPEDARSFDFLQVFLAGLTALALVCLFRAITHGLLGLPDMQIAGNGSTRELLQWYQDRSGPALPRATAVSAPLWLYRAAMLAWALWLASSLISWLKWGWGRFSQGGLWKELPKRAAAPPKKA